MKLEPVSVLEINNVREGYELSSVRAELKSSPPPKKKKILWVSGLKFSCLTADQQSYPLERSHHKVQAISKLQTNVSNLQPGWRTLLVVEVNRELSLTVLPTFALLVCSL